ncbi:MAG: tRNA (adenosine(37)-N6)-threonylcarbamoyltransferase complex ATPase subunit type 1 TsaE [Bacteroidia bacterium]|nr:tRNA (adenosine(37)-N6)-threonylcarbamoyltransferase complex ATPase subunit type 1 TsaE [Bacteroidia bacterium]
MSNLSFTISAEEELPLVASKLLAFAGDRKVFLFYGEMGSGKTTFIKTLCEALGVKEGLSSPTYSIVNEYISENGKKIYHFDLYRLKNIAECMDIGMEEYLYSGNYCFVEWPEIAERIYPDGVVKVKINVVDEKRVFEFQLH